MKNTNRLTTHFKFPDSEIRLSETTECLKKNIEINFFDNIDIILESPTELEVSTIDKLAKQSKSKTKVSIHFSKKRLTFREIFRECNFNPNEIHYVTNSDIHFTNDILSMSKIYPLLNSGIVLCQHRYNKTKSGKIIFEATPPIPGGLYSGSADSFIFKTPIEFGVDFSFFPGTSYCDQHISKLLFNNQRAPISICDISCIHLHSEKINELGRVTDEDYSCPADKHCKKNLTNSDLQYNPILTTNEALELFNIVNSYADEDSEYFNTLFMFFCQKFIQAKHALNNENNKTNTMQVISNSISKLISLNVHSISLAKSIHTKSPFSWNGFPNPEFLLESKIFNQ